MITTTKAKRAEQIDAEMAAIVAYAAWNGGWTIRDCVKDDIEQAIEDGSDIDSDIDYLVTY